MLSSLVRQFPIGSLLLLVVVAVGLASLPLIATAQITILAWIAVIALLVILATL